MNYSEFSAQISNKIISILETGKLSWRQTWKVSLPHNFVSKRRLGRYESLMGWNEDTIALSRMMESRSD